MPEVNDAAAAARPEICLDDRLVAATEVESVELDGELVVLDLRSGALHRLDPIASVVWPVLDGSVSVAELAAELAEAYQAPLEVVQPDLLSLLANLGRVGLLEGIPADTDYAPTVPGQQSVLRPASSVSHPPGT